MSTPPHQSVYINGHSVPEQLQVGGARHLLGSLWQECRGAKRRGRMLTHAMVDTQQELQRLLRGGVVCECDEVSVEDVRVTTPVQ